MSSQLSPERCSDEITMLVRVVEEHARTIDRDNLIRKDVMDAIMSSGVLQLDETSLGNFLCTLRAVASASPAVAHTLLVHASSWLASGKPSLEKGELLALSVTEPGGGTDLRASLKTTAERSGDSWRITGTKIFTSNAPYASRFIVLAISPSGPTLFTVSRSENIKITLLDIIGLRGTGASIVEYSEAPGEPVGVPGKGVKEALKGINLGRIGYGAIALGIIDASLKLIISYGKEKIIFGRSLLDYQGVKWMIAEIYSKRSLLESLLESVIQHSQGTWLVDPEKAAIAKTVGARAAQEAAWAATQLMGGRGLERWSVTDRMQRDARALDIGEGAREVLLDYIANQAVKTFS